MSGGCPRLSMLDLNRGLAELTQASALHGPVADQPPRTLGWSPVQHVFHLRIAACQYACQYRPQTCDCVPPGTLRTAIAIQRGGHWA
jgi:hypothetical protein